MSQQINIHQSRGPQREKPRREGRRRVRVRFREGASQTVVASQCVRKSNADADGAVEIIAYESDVPRIQALIEPNADALRLAKEAHARDLRKYLAEKTSVRVEDVPTDPAQWSDDVKKLASVYGGSVEAKFFDVMGRGILPLVSVDVDDEILDPPLGEHEESVAAVARQFAGGSSVADTIAALVEAGVLPVAAPAKTDTKGRK